MPKPAIRSLISQALLPIILLVCLISGCQQSGEVRDPFGGSISVQREASGFFRVERVADRWFFITPAGHPYLALGANHTGKFLQDSSQSGALLARFDGSVNAAQQELHRLYRELGYNAGEAYAPHDPYLQQQLPYIAHISYPTRSHFARDIFSEAVRDSIYQSTVAQCRALSEDSMVIGFAFKDLPIWDSRRINYYRQLPARAPGKQQYVSFLGQRYADIDSLNAAYGWQFNDFEEIASREEWPEGDHYPPEDEAAFMALIADTLYSVLSKAVRQGAPHHLFLGERYQLRSIPDPVLSVIGKYVDVFLTQALIRSPQRPPEWQVFQRDAYDHEYALTQKPMLIVDWATPFSLSETYENANGTIKNEAEAAKDTQQWLEQAFALPYLVGVFKCQLIGTHPNDHRLDNDAKRTLLQDDGSYFDHMTPVMQQTHRQVLQNAYQQLEK